ncbi:MAG: hypothetical protein K6A77_04780 [Clostridiales bacterium]|nr:hypothetical protein [Clostridiales bacterium]
MKQRRFLCIVMICVLLFSGCSLLNREETEKIPEYTFGQEGNYDVAHFDNVTLEIDLGYLQDKERNYAAYQVDGATKAVKAYLKDRTQKDVVLILRAGDGPTMVYEGQAEIYYAQNRTTPYTSLITQVMMGVDGVPDWLREGVGAYVAETNKESLLKTQAHLIDCLNTYVAQEEAERAEDSEAPQEAVYYDIDTLASVLKKNGAYDTASQLGDMTEQIAAIGYPEEAYNFRGAYCIYAGSFVKYLEANYGHDAVMAAYDGTEFSEAFGVSFEAARKAWFEAL